MCCRVSTSIVYGQVDDANHDLGVGAIGKNLLFGGNAYFHVAPNVLMGLEASQCGRCIWDRECESIITMIWRWLICSSVGLGAAFGAVVTARWS